VWLTGPAGSGKTTAAHNCAKALGLEFRFCGAQSNEYGLLGFTDANGRTVRTPFREAYEHGGVFLFDEVDASSASAVLAFNAALANGVCNFPDAIVERHEKFVCIAAANTFGLGATNDYVGRMKQNAAFIDRFVSLAWDIDEALETSLSGNATWAKRVQHLRKRATDLGLKVVISPRASMYGAKLIAAGMHINRVEALTVRKGMTSAQWESIS
jgi:MoxR-like ATPase